ncbi:MAG: glycosyltransferase [Bacillota bacterium]|nr:glycosyltransferase [Bacillota bacterium]
MSTYQLGLASALSDAGHLVDIYTRKTDPEAPAVLKVFPGVRLLNIDDGQGNLAKNEIYPCSSQVASAIYRFIELDTTQTKGGYNILFSHYWLSGVAGQLLKQKFKLPHLVMFHTLGRAKNEACLEEKEPPERIREEENLARNCDLLVAAAESEKERLCNYYNLLPGKVARIYCGIDRRLFKPHDPFQARRELGLGSEKIILFVGRTEPVKGLDLLIRAAALLPLEDNFKVILIGGDSAGEPLIAGLKELAAGLGIPERIIFMGTVDHQRLPLFYSAAAVTAIPSYYESLSLAALESLACGTPLVAGRVGIIPELLTAYTESPLGWMIEKRDPALWASSLRSALLRNEKINQSIIDHVLAPFNWTAAADHLDARCRELL